ncbi:hypothetical protein Gpo141_00014187 [Globisporangium polare]
MSSSCGDSSSEHEALGNSHAIDVGAELKPRKRRRRARATYHVRRDEIQVLQSRMEELELELKALRFQALVQSNNTSDDMRNESGGSAAEQTSAPTHSKRQLTRHLLKDAIQSQQFTLAGLQAMLSKYSSLQETSPLHVGIQLTSAPQERRQTLLAARTTLLQDAKRFIKARSEGMDPLVAFSEHERFETPQGDYCVTSFEILPLPSSPTSLGVKGAFDALYFLIRNVEITFSEWIGHITIRENDESLALDDKYSQHRLVATVAPTTAQIETNVVTFSEFQCLSDTGDADELGIIAVDSIDADELYPYQSSERVRRDTSGVFVLQSHSAGPDDEMPNVVTLLRWSLSKLHASELLKHDLRGVQDVRASLGKWGEKLMQALYEAAVHAAVDPQPASTSISSNTGDDAPGAVAC